MDGHDKSMDNRDNIRINDQRRVVSHREDAGLSGFEWVTSRIHEVAGSS
jgi:hypothetical protein